MKNLLKPLFGAIILTAVLTACKPSAEEARKYNDKIIDLERPLTDKQNTFYDKLGGQDNAELQKAYEEFAAQAQTSYAEAQKIEPFDKNREFLDAALNFFKTLSEQSKNEYKEIVELVSKKTEDLTDADSQRIQDLAKKVDDSYSKVLEDVKTAQDKFSKEWKFRIEDTTATSEAK